MSLKSTRQGPPHPPPWRPADVSQFQANAGSGQARTSQEGQKTDVAGAIEDQSFDAAQKERLEMALTDAGVDHLVETYNARHGFVPRDTPVHDANAEAKHWQTLFALFDDTLKGESADPSLRSG